MQYVCSTSPWQGAFAEACRNGSTSSTSSESDRSAGQASGSSSSPSRSGGGQRAVGRGSDSSSSQKIDKQASKRGSSGSSSTSSSDTGSSTSSSSSSSSQSSGSPVRKRPLPAPRSSPSPPSRRERDLNRSAKRSPGPDPKRRRRSPTPPRRDRRDVRDRRDERGGEQPRKGREKSREDGWRPSSPRSRRGREDDTGRSGGGDRSRQRGTSLDWRSSYGRDGRPDKHEDLPGPPPRPRQVSERPGREPAGHGSRPRRGDGRPDADTSNGGLAHGDRRESKWTQGQEPDERAAREGPPSGEVWGTEGNRAELKKEEKEVEPNFGLSGALAEETNKVNGVVLVYSEPLEASNPTLRWRLYIFKGGELTGEPLYIHRQSSYLFGRERRVVDVPADHPSCSKQHAVLQYRRTTKVASDGMPAEAVRPYMMDLGSTNGTFINSERLESQRYYELIEKDVIKLGNSSREYVLLHEGSLNTT